MLTTQKRCEYKILLPSCNANGKIVLFFCFFSLKQPLAFMCHRFYIRNCNFPKNTPLLPKSSLWLVVGFKTYFLTLGGRTDRLHLGKVFNQICMVSIDCTR